MSRFTGYKNQGRAHEWDIGAIWREPGGSTHTASGPTANYSYWDIPKYERASQYGYSTRATPKAASYTHSSARQSPLQAAISMTGNPSPAFDHSLPATPVTASYSSSFQERLVSGRKGLGKGWTSGSGFERPGKLATAFGGGMAGYYAGGQDAQSAVAGAAGGFIGGHLLESMAKDAYPALGRLAKTTTGNALKAVNMGRLLTSASNRSLLFAGGALLGGAAFGAIFGGSGRTLNRGFNSNRGNQITR